MIPCISFLKTTVCMHLACIALCRSPPAVINFAWSSFKDCSDGSLQRPLTVRGRCSWSLWISHQRQQCLPNEGALLPSAARPIIATYGLRISASVYIYIIIIYVYIYISVSRSPGARGKRRVQNGVSRSLADAIFNLMVQKQAEIWTSLLHSFIK